LERQIEDLERDILEKGRTGKYSLRKKKKEKLK